MPPKKEDLVLNGSAKSSAPCFTKKTDYTKKLMVTGCTEIKSKYQKARNLYFHLVNLKKTEYYQSKFHQYKSNIKKLGNA